MEFGERGEPGAGETDAVDDDMDTLEGALRARSFLRSFSSSSSSRKLAQYKKESRSDQTAYSENKQVQMCEHTVVK